VTRVKATNCRMSQTPDEYKDMLVDLDSSTVDGTYYPIFGVIPDQSTILLVTTDDLSGYVGKELAGVHQLSLIEVEGNATFGHERVVVGQGETVEFFSSTISSVIVDEVMGTGDFKVDGTDLTGAKVLVGNLDVTDSEMSIGAIAVAGDMTVGSSAGESGVLNVNVSTIGVGNDLSVVTNGASLNFVCQTSFEVGGNATLTANGQSIIVVTSPVWNVVGQTVKSGQVTINTP